MSKEDTYAFPFDVDFTQYTGMTLRDYFAAKTLQGILASAEDAIKPEHANGLAFVCYRIAEAMLKEREK